MNNAIKTFESNIPGRYSVNEAAKLLGVSGVLVNQLIHSGTLEAIKTAGGAFLIDARSLNDYGRIRRGRGRPWNSDIAWAALWLLSGQKVDWLTYQQRRRLLIGLRTIEAEELIWVLRKRSKSLKFWAGKSVFSQLSETLSLTGKSSDIIERIGLTDNSDTIEGYVYNSEMQNMISRYHLLTGDDTNVIIRTVDSSPFDLKDFAQMPEAVAAVDLCTSSTTRERSAGLKRLKELLSENHQATLSGR